MSQSEEFTSFTVEDLEALDEIISELEEELEELVLNNGDLNTIIVTQHALDAFERHNSLFEGDSR
ncbi:hypothetical protein ACOZ35_03295 [Halorubrum xinjiangense]|uniref:hypothetical protein n=1 Tax=Halorubrum xinjiangense TaxID=261291 RepID=UPI003C6EECA1